MALSIIQIIICVLIIVLVLVQESPKGGSSALTGGAESDSHYDKIKGRTGGAILKKSTAVLGILFVVMTFVINL